MSRLTWLLALLLALPGFSVQAQSGPDEPVVFPRNVDNERHRASGSMTAWDPVRARLVCLEETRTRGHTLGGVELYSWEETGPSAGCADRYAADRALFEPLIKSVMEHFRGTRFPPPTRLGPVLEDSQGRYLGVFYDTDPNSGRFASTTNCGGPTDLDRERSTIIFRPEAYLVDGALPADMAHSFIFTFAHEFSHAIVNSPAFRTGSAILGSGSAFCSASATQRKGMLNRKSSIDYVPYDYGYIMEGLSNHYGLEALRKIGGLKRVGSSHRLFKTFYGLHDYVDGFWSRDIANSVSGAFVAGYKTSSFWEHLQRAHGIAPAAFFEQSYVTADIPELEPDQGRYLTRLTQRLGLRVPLPMALAIFYTAHASNMFNTYHIPAHAREKALYQSFGNCMKVKPEDGEMTVTVTSWHMNPFSARCLEVDLSAAVGDDIHYTLDIKASSPDDGDPDALHLGSVAQYHVDRIHPRQACFRILARGGVLASDSDPKRALNCLVQRLPPEGPSSSVRTGWRARALEPGATAGMREMFVLSYIPTADGLGFRDEVRMGDTASTKTFELTIELKLQRSEEAPSTGNWRDGDVEVSWVIPRSDLLKSPLPMAVLHLGRDPRTESISPTLLEIEAAGGELLDGIRGNVGLMQAASAMNPLRMQQEGYYDALLGLMPDRADELRRRVPWLHGFDIIRARYRINDGKLVGEPRYLYRAILMHLVCTNRSAVPEAYAPAFSRFPACHPSLMKVGDAFEVHAGSYLEYDAQNTPKMQSTPLGFIIPQVTVDEVPVFAGRITLLERNEDILRLRFQAQFCLTWKDGACNQPTRHLDFEMDFSVDDLSYQQPPTVARPSPVQEWYDRVFWQSILRSRGAAGLPDTPYVRESLYRDGAMQLPLLRPIPKNYGSDGGGGGTLPSCDCGCEERLQLEIKLRQSPMTEPTLDPASCHAACCEAFKACPNVLGSSLAVQACMALDMLGLQ